MKQQNSKTKKTLLSSVIVLIVCVAMLLGTTFAWFTDSVSNTGNRIQAGTLKIQLLMDKNLDNNYVDISNGTGDIFSSDTVAQNSNKTLWEPGKTQWVALAVHNEGSLQAKYNIVLDVVDEGLLDQGGESSLQYVLLDGKKAADMKSATSWEDIQTLAGMTAQDVRAGRITAAPNGELEQKGAANEADYDYFVLAVHMKENAGNDYQDKAAVIDVNVVATQLAAELDGFKNNTYDKDAFLPVIPDRVDGWGLSNQTRATDGTQTSEMKITVVKIESEEEEIGETTVPQAAVESVLNELLSELPEAPEGKLIEDTLILTVNVETKDVTTESMKLDITMDGAAVRTQRDQGASAEDAEIIQQAAQPVTELAAPVSVVLSIPRNLRDVNVDHTHGIETTAMTRVYSKTDLVDGKFFYDADTGELILMTKKFSEFNITYYVPIVASIGDKGYSTFEAALADYDGATPITLVESINYEGTIINKDVVIDANQKDFAATATADVAINVKNASKVVFAAAEGKTLSVNEGNCKELNIKGMGKVAIAGGYFDAINVANDANLAISDGVFKSFNVTEGAKVTITGGIFGSDPAKYYSKSYHAVLITEGDYKGMYQIVKYGSGICRINDTLYSSFDEAMQAFKDGDTLYVLSDCVVPQKGVAGSTPDYSPTNMTLFVDEGATLTFQRTSNQIFQPKGTFNIEGTGTISFAGATFANPPEGGSVQFKDITINGGGSGELVYSSSYSKVTIKNGYYTGMSSWYDGSGSEDNFVIEGGYFDQDMNTYVVAGKGCTKLTEAVKGCTYKVEDLSVKNAAVMIQQEGQPTKYYTKINGLTVPQGSTLTLLRDVRGKLNPISVDDVTINLNGKTWEPSSDAGKESTTEAYDYAISLLNCNNVTIKNGTFASSDQDAKWAIAVNSNVTNLTIDGINSKLQSYYAKTIWFVGSTSGSTVTAKNINIYNLTQKGVSEAQPFTGMYAGCLGIESGYIEMGKLTPDFARYIADGSVLVSDKANEFTITKGGAVPETYTAKLGTNVYWTYAGGANEAIRTAVSGDTVTIAEVATQEKILGKTDTLTVVFENEATWTGVKAVDGYEVVATPSGENTVVYTTKIEATCKIGSTEYATLADAVAACDGNAKTITLIKDATASSTVQFNKNNITFDLNGHTYTYTGTGYAIKFYASSGTTYVKDNSGTGKGKIYCPNGSGIEFGKKNAQIYSITIEAKKTALGLNQTNGQAKCYIYSGTFIGGNAAVSSSVYYQSPQPYVLSGGTYQGTLSINTAGCSITGGYYSVDPTAYTSGSVTYNEETGLYKVN